MDANNNSFSLLTVAALTVLLAGCPTASNPQKPAVGSEPENDQSSAASQPLKDDGQQVAAAPAVAVVVPKPQPEPVIKPQPKPDPKPVKPPKPKYMGEKKLLVVGSVERLTISPPGLKLRARIDTGAETTSLHADPIVRFERDGKRWVRFTLQANPDAEPVVLERPVERRVRIKRHDADSQRRYVVKLWLQLGEIKEHVEVTLTDRSEFTYPLLVGRNWLTDTAVVDVSRRYIIK
ncbi:ATP-dependent zinc protease [Porticoccus sp. W117]|uniref:ATP-dependent zinc protease family protein n=1 Tax=Porticoccus sp. W117 TaxID=3054777 RepID=UPI0025914328|nr:ATP-dependent zinc protease [Porticoccus sp. W117]MDM3871159.1 ATP-dependent zinc protease [Porticoccus sp. W117]